MATQTHIHRKKNSTSKAASDGPNGIWLPLLDSVGTGKRLAEKSLLVLGGNTTSQREFLDVLAEESPQGRRNLERTQRKPPPVANRFALGYSYQDILDVDHDDVLARLSLYLLSDRQSAFSTLLEPLFTPETIPNTVVVVLLDWEEPWAWARQLRDWIRIVRLALGKLDNDCVEAMNDNMKQWSERRKGQAVDSLSAADTEVTVSLGPGEWDEPLGIPICCVCHGAEKTEILEREHGWKDDEFDFILQFMRTVLLKHGGSLIYTASSAPGSLHTLLRSMLGVHSLLQRNLLKHNVIDRDKILVPPNWDSWGKIRPLSESFNIEGISTAWSVDTQPRINPGKEPRESSEEMQATDGDSNDAAGPSQAVNVYEGRIEDPSRHQSSALQFGSLQGTGIDTPSQDIQTFLANQSQLLEKLKSDDERDQRTRDAKRLGTSAAAARDTSNSTASRVNEHLGPVQFNMGGIQVDADDALKSLKEREATRASSEDSKAASPDPSAGPENLNSFFAGLINRGSTPGANSPRLEPRRAEKSSLNGSERA